MPVLSICLSLLSLLRERYTSAEHPPCSPSPLRALPLADLLLAASAYLVLVSAWLLAVVLVSVVLVALVLALVALVALALASAVLLGLSVTALTGACACHSTHDTLPRIVSWAPAPSIQSLHRLAADVNVMLLAPVAYSTATSSIPACPNGYSARV